MIEWKNIIIHHSAAAPEMSIDAIRRWHIMGRHFKDIGYHYIIKKYNGSYEIVMGRMPTVEGAHCIGRNSDSIGICVLGDFEMFTPEAGALEKLVQLCAAICESSKGSIVPGNIYPHSYFADTKCPGKYMDISCVVADVTAGLNKNHIGEPA